MMSEAQFIARKVQLKLTDAAHAKGFVLGIFLLQAVRALASGTGKTGLGPGAVVSGGRLATPLSFVPPDRKAKNLAVPGKTRDLEIASSDEGNERIMSLQSRVLQLQSSLLERNLLADAAEAALNRAAAVSEENRRETAVATLREVGLESLRRNCTKLESEVRKLGDAAEQAAPQVKNAEKSDKALRKMQVKVDEMEEKRGKLEKDATGTKSRLGASSGTETATSSAEAASSKKCEDLKRKINELETQISTHLSKKGEAEEDQNRKQAEAIENATQDKLKLTQKIETVNRDTAKRKDDEAQSRAKLAQMQQVQQKLNSKVKPLQKAVAKLRDEQHRVKAEVKAESSKGFNDSIQKLVAGVTSISERKKEVETQYITAMEDRKKLHNLVLDLKGNIRVFVRCRPINAKEKQLEPEGEVTVDFKDDLQVGIYEAAHARRKWFDFDACFQPTTTQSKVFEEVEPLATSVLDGYKVCIFAYGQTGSGKTHSMAGPASDPGLNTRVLRELFKIRDERTSTHEMVFTVAITEIYNETIRDLLNPGSKKLDVKLNSDGSCSIPGLYEETVQSTEDVMKCIDISQKSRSTGCTDMNEQSSRSHSIVTVKTAVTVKGSDAGTYHGKINLVDLAGSENVGKSGATGQLMKEAQNINKSLSALGDVIQSLVAKNTHCPYRNSKLTMMLKDSLGGDSKTLMIVCTSPAQFNVQETLSSLNFASRARNVELGKAKRNVT